MRYLSPSESDNDGRAALSLQPSDCVYAITLPAGGAKTVEIPQDAMHAVFSATVDFFIRFGDEDIEDAELPTGDIVDGSGCEMSPGMRTIPEEVSHMSVIGIETGVMTISFYGG